MCQPRAPLLNFNVLKRCGESRQGDRSWKLRDGDYIHMSMYTYIYIYVRICV